MHEIVWERPTTEETEVIDLYALKSNREGTLAWRDVVSDTRASTSDQFSKPAVSMTKNTKGAKEWKN
jgi:SecD/SecF fusion protein